MAGESTAVYPTANSIQDKTASSTFIPEWWSDEVIAEYEKTLKMKPLVKAMSMKGKKGDVIHVPKPLRGAAAAKAESTAVTIQAKLEEELTITIDQHFEYSRLIEDIVGIQALSSHRQAITQDAGYQLALQVDTALINAFTGMGDGTMDLSSPATASWVHSNSYYVDAANGLAVFADATVASGDNFTDLAFREAIKLMDDANVPMDSRCLVIPPVARKDIMGTDYFTTADYRDARTVQSGLIGNIYGVDIYVSSNCPTTDANVRGCLFFHKDAVVLAEQLSVRTQTQYKQEYLADLFTADTLYGVQAYRPEAGFVINIYDA